MHSADVAHVPFDALWTLEIHTISVMTKFERILATVGVAGQWIFCLSCQCPVAVGAKRNALCGAAKGEIIVHSTTTISTGHVISRPWYR
jgi:hypothetical protein